MISAPSARGGAQRLRLESHQAESAAALLLLVLLWLFVFVVVGPKLFSLGLLVILGVFV